MDFLLTIPGYEELLIQRAISFNIEDLSLRTCTAEDLIIQKVIAGRSKDWQDIQGILIEQFDILNQMYIEEWLHQFAEILEPPELITQYQTNRENLISSRSGI